MAATVSNNNRALEGKVVVLIGGAGLLGKAAARATSAAGATTIIADISRDGAEAAAAATRNGNPDLLIHAESVDITDPASLDQLAARVSACHGRVDSVVNAAYPRNPRYGARLEDVTFADFCENVNVHLGGYFLATQRFAIFFERQGHGHVVNFSSIYGFVAPRFEIYANTAMTMPVEYAACKSALLHLSKYFMRYYRGTRLRFNCLSPGGILDGQPEGFVDAYNRFSQNKGMLAPDDICGALVFLLSDASEHVNGQNIVVDDGWSA